MSFFTNLRADRLVTEIRSATDPSEPGGAEGHRAAEGTRPGRDRSRVRRAARRRQERHHGVRRGAGEPGQPEDLPAVRARAGRGQPAGDRRHLLGAHQQPQLPAAPAARGARRPGHLQVRDPRGHRRAEDPLQRARTAQRRLHAGAEREGGAVPHHRRDRRARPRCPSSSGGCRARTRSRACTSSTSWRASTRRRCRPRCRRC